MDGSEFLLHELRSAVNSPKLYLVKYFDDIRNQIDICCESYLQARDLTVRAKEIALQKQQEMISAVDLFEKECLINLETNTGGLVGLDELECSLKSLDPTNKEKVLQVEKSVYCQLYERKKFLFMNKGIIFFDMDNCCQYLPIQCHPQVLFGHLFIIEDEFLLFSEKFLQIKDDQAKTDRFDEFFRIVFIRKRLRNELLDEKEFTLLNRTNNDWCSEFLRIHYMKKYLENKLTNLPEQTTPTVMSRIRLDLGQQETLEYFYYKRMILKECLVELPALRKVILISCFLTELDPTTFQNLLHLEELDLSFNLIRVLDEKTFSGNKNLTVLRLSGNEIKSLSKETFKGLSKLTQLYFYNNYLRLIPEGLFQDLSSLRFVYLDNNRINFLDGNGSQQSSDVFKGLESLTLLELGCNSISVIPKGIFKHLVSLRNLHLYGNKLNLYDLYEASKYLKGFKRKFKVIWNQSTLS